MNVFHTHPFVVILQPYLAFQCFTPLDRRGLILPQLKPGCGMSALIEVRTGPGGRGQRTRAKISVSEKQINSPSDRSFVPTTYPNHNDWAPRGSLIASRQKTVFRAGGGYYNRLGAMVATDEPDRFRAKWRPTLPSTLLGATT